MYSENEENSSKRQLMCFKSFRIKSDHFRSKWIRLKYRIHIFNKSKICLTWNRWNIIIFLFLLLQGGGHFWKKLVKTVGVLVCLKQHTGSYWLHSGMCRVAEMHYSATKAKRVFSFSTCHIGPNEWINNIVVPSFTIRCTQAVLHIDLDIKKII